MKNKSGNLKSQTSTVTYVPGLKCYPCPRLHTPCFQKGETSRKTSTSPIDNPPAVHYHALVDIHMPDSGIRVIRSIRQIRVQTGGIVPVQLRPQPRRFSPALHLLKD